MWTVFLAATGPTVWSHKEVTKFTTEEICREVYAGVMTMTYGELPTTSEEQLKTQT